MNVRVWRILLRRLSGNIVVWIIHLPVSWLLSSTRSVSWIQFPSDSGIWPVKKNELKKFEAEVYTDTTLALEFVVSEIKHPKFDTFPEWFGNLTCGQKKRFSKISRQKCTRIIHLPSSLLWSSWRSVNLVQFPSDSGISPVKKKKSRNLRATCRTDHTLTREVVGIKPKLSQLGTIPKWFRNLTCQKEGLWEIQGKIVWWIIHLPVSWFSSSQSWVNLVQFPSDLGIWPVKKNELKKFEGDL
jgi:hypothetical protein